MTNSTDANPLLDFADLPPFSAIRAEHVQPAVDELLAYGREETERLLRQHGEPSWAGLIEPLQEIDDRLSRSWSPVSHLNGVRNSPELRDAYNACLPKWSDYATEMGQNPELYRAYRQLADHAGQLNPAQRKVLENALRDFHLAGVDLPHDKQRRFREVSQRLSSLASRFQDHVLDATHAFKKSVLDQNALAGLPESALQLARQEARNAGQDGWLLTLDFPCYLAVMTYAEDRELRREFYTAFSTRASDQGPHAGQWDNLQLMGEILQLRHELAGLLGFDNYAERSLATKMAASTDQVMAFLDDLAVRSRPQALREFASLQAFAQSLGGPHALQAWDVAYYSELQRQHLYHFSEEQLKPYFPHTRVVAGLFEVASRLFGVRIEEVDAFDSWHPDVRLYRIADAEGELYGHFYIDLFARAKKRGGAWMDDCRGRLRTSLREQTPVAYLVCNFTPPVEGRPALLSHDEVTTLFHEFGHGLHHLLTRVDYPEIAGINGVAWDAVELPSQFMENFCWQRESLDLIAAHWQSGEPLPDDLFRKMVAARNFQSAMQMVRQLEFALFDFRLHLQPRSDIYSVLQQVREQVAVVPYPDFNRMPNSFTHIFGGGYAAGYYSYKWAEVLSADAFELFEEQGIFDAATGRRFLREILEKGGSEDAMRLFVAFRGREPRIDALLRHSGIGEHAA